MIMKKFVTYLMLFITLGFFFACDVIEEPYIEENATVWNGRKILILDFTGHHCPNCPEGHRKMEQLQETFPEAIVPVAIHATYFARFDENAEEFNYNFTTPVGIELGGSTIGVPGYFSISGLPVAAVNTFLSDNMLPPGGWATEIATYISTFPEVSIEIEGTVNLTDNTVDAELSIENLIPSERNLKLGVYLIESGIISWQEDNAAEHSPVEDYEHNHVLRAGLTETFGVDINTGNASMDVGNIISKSFSVEIDDAWNLDHCGVVAFVYDNDTKEVLQAEEIHLAE